VLRLLREVRGVPVTSLREVVAALDDPDLPVHAAITLIADVIATLPAVPGEQDPASLDIVDEVLREVGWEGIHPESIDRLRLASLVSLLNGTGPMTADVEVLSFYAQAADQMARAELAALDLSLDRDALLEEMLTGSVAYGQMFRLLRQLGHEHHHQRLSQAAASG
jgi:hypothetical protein